MLHLVRTLLALGVGVSVTVSGATSASADVRRDPTASRQLVDPALQALEGDALAVQLQHVSPGVLTSTTRGRVTIRGVVGNPSDEVWANISLYALISTVPVTDEVGLTAAVESDPLLPIGERITEEDNFVKIGDLEPGQQATFSFSVRRALLPVSEPGIYWLGVQALGENEVGRDLEADGRARVLIPLLDAPQEPVPMALVAPIRQPLAFTVDGRLAGEDVWVEDLAAGGHLRQVADWGADERSQAVTWVLDPAVIWGVSHLAQGNPARLLGADEVAGAEPADTAAESASLATSYLTRTAFLSEHRAFVLPFGDVDISAAAGYGDLVAAAQERSAQMWARSRPVVMPASGALDPRSLATLDPTSTVILDQAALPDVDESLLQLGGRRVVRTEPLSFASRPGDASGGLAARQWLLARAVTAQLRGDTDPQVWSFDPAWMQADPGVFLEGLDSAYLDLESLPQLWATTELSTYSSQELVYPDRAAEQKVSSSNFVAARRLLAAAALADQIFRRGTAQADDLEVVALTSLAVMDPTDSALALRVTERSTSALVRFQSQITVSGPTTLRLLSETGSFSVVVTNGTNQPVRLAVSAEALSSTLTVDGGRTVSLPPGAHTSVKFEASTPTIGLSQVVVRATTVDGDPVGISDTIPVRAAQVSRLMWLIVGSGLALLFAAIALRLVRRVRAGHTASIDTSGGPDE